MKPMRACTAGTHVHPDRPSAKTLSTLYIPTRVGKSDFCYFP